MSTAAHPASPAPLDLEAIRSCASDDMPFSADDELDDAEFDALPAPTVVLGIAFGMIGAGDDRAGDALTVVVALSLEDPACPRQSTLLRVAHGPLAAVVAKTTALANILGVAAIKVDSSGLGHALADALGPFTHDCRVEPVAVTRAFRAGATEHLRQAFSDRGIQIMEDQALISELVSFGSGGDPLRSSGLTATALALAYEAALEAVPRVAAGGPV